MCDSMNIRHVAGLARLQLDGQEEKSLCEDMAQILAFARQLQQLDLTDIPPTQHILDRVNVLREDIPEGCLPQEVLLAAAPAVQGEYIIVPRAVE